MTLKELRSRWLNQIQNLNPAIIPDKNGLTRQAIRDLTRAVGGIHRSTTLTTTAGTREYDTDNSFPSDFDSMVQVLRSSGNTNIPLDPIFEREKNENTSRGVPNGYYIIASSIGFDVIPDDAYTITMRYKGLSDDVTADGTTVLGEYSTMDDDPVWDVITHYCLRHYYKLMRAKAMELKDYELLREVRAILLEIELEYRTMRARAVRALRKFNSDKAFEIELPEDYFTVTRQSFVERASNTGDVIRMF